MSRDNGEVQEIDARPSDSIAIALKTGAPIFVAAELFDIGEEEGLPERINDPESLKERLAQYQPGRLWQVFIVVVADSPTRMQSPDDYSPRPDEPKRYAISIVLWQMH